MAKTLSKTLATALFCGAVALAGPSFAAQHAKDVAHHTKHVSAVHHGKNLAQMDQMERQTTAELNRAQLANGAQAQAMTMPETVAMTETEEFTVASSDDDNE